MRKELQSVRKALYALVGIQFLCNFVLGAPMKYLESAALVGFDMAIGGSLALIMLLAVLTFVFAGAKRGALKLKMLRVIYIGYGIGIFLCFWCQIRTAKLLKEGLVYVKRFINRGIGGKALSRHGLNSLAALEKINVLVVICEFVLLGMMLWVLWKEMGELNIRKPVRGKMDINSDRVILLCNRCKADENRKLRIKRTEYGIFTEAEFRKKCKKEKLYSQLCKICYVTDCRNEEEFESVLEQIYRENVHDTENSNVNRQILIINVCSGGMTEIPQFYENLLWLRVCYVPDIDWITEHEIMSRLMVREEGWVSEYYANPIKFQNEFAECFEVNPVFADEMIRNFYNGSKASMAVLQSVMAQLDYVELCVRLSMYYYVLKNIGELQGKGEEELKLIKEAFAGGASSRRILPTELNGMAATLLRNVSEQDKIYDLIHKKYYLQQSVAELLKRLESYMNVSFSGDKITFQGLCSTLSVIRNKVIAHGTLREKNIYDVWAFLVYATMAINEMLCVKEMKLFKREGRYFLENLREDRVVSLGKFVIDSESVQIETEYGNNIYAGYPCIAWALEEKNAGKGLYLVRYTDYFSNEMIKPMTIEKVLDDMI